jgi:hypothetical protein
VLVLAEAAPAAHHYTAWENLGYALLLFGAVCLFVCYRFAFKIKAKCMVIGNTTKRPCKRDASVVLGCQDHRWDKPVAWFRHLGAASWLDPWLNRFHIVPPSFAPVPMPVVETAPAGNLLTVMAVAPVAQSNRMSRDLKVACWSLVCGIVQATTGIIALWIAS